MKRLIVILTAPFLLWPTLSPSVAFEGDTLEVGGPGGAEFHAPCGPGEAAVGLYYTAGKDLDEVATVCQALQGDKVIGPQHNLLAHGGLSLIDFSGRWAADNVAYSLSAKQKGSDGSAGTISGKMNGNVLRFGWVQKDGTRGSGKFVLSGDGQSFDGTYSFGDIPDAVEGSWNGTRQ